MTLELLMRRIAEARLEGHGMQMAFCSSCDRMIGYRRAFGWGTFFTVILTGGLWLLALPFYPLRCTGCGTEWKLFSQPLRPPGDSGTR